MSDDIPICVCGHVSAHHLRKEPFIPSRPKLGPCVKRVGVFVKSSKTRWRMTMPDPAEVTKEMVEAGAAEFRRITKGDGVLTPQETRMDIHEMATHHILTAARQHDPLVAEVVRLREENERLREEVERLRQSAPQALSALENYGQHHSWCDKRMAPNCPCGFNATVVGLQVMVFAERIGAEVSDSLSDSDGTQQ